MYKRQYTYNGTSWGSEQKLTASDAASSDNFGWSVSISGDYAIIGAYRDNDTSNRSGSAYIFKRDATTGVWSQQQKLNASDPSTDAEFGYSVAIDGDYAIVGAWRKSSYTGAAYIYTRNGTTWGSEQKITSSDIASGDRFGQSVSISGNYLIVSGEGDENYTGAAYICLLYTSPSPRD